MPSFLLNVSLTHTSALLIDPQTVGEREADIKRLQEQLTEANLANEASQATQASQNQSSQSIHASDASTAGDVNQALQEELAKLRQEVLWNPAYLKKYLIQLLS